MSVRTTLYGLTAAAAVGLLLWTTLGSTGAGTPARTIDEHLVRREPAPVPAVSLPVLGGRAPRAFGAAWSRAAADGRVRLAELRGTPMLINLWASWCTPCQREAPLLRAFWRDASKSRVLFVGINTQDRRADAIAFDGYYRLDYPNLHDPRGLGLDAFSGNGLPETYFVNATGQIVAHVVGELDRVKLRSGLIAAQTGEPLAPMR